MTSIKKQIYRECAQAMMVPVVFNALSEILASTLLIITANTLGGFADAALSLNWDLGLEQSLLLALCVAATVLLAPAVSMAGEMTMLKQALAHDRMVFGHFLDKRPQAVRADDAGELQFTLEDAPIDLRIQWVLLASRGIALPISFAYLLYCAGGISWLLTGAMLALALLRLTVPMALRKKLAHCEKEKKEYLAQRRGQEGDIVNHPAQLQLWRLEEAMLRRLERRFDQYFSREGKAYEGWQVLCAQLTDYVNKTTQVLVFVISAVLVAKGTVTPGQLTAMMLYFGVSQTLLGNLGDTLKNFPLLRLAADRVVTFYEDTEPAGGTVPGPFEAISADHIRVCFGEKQGVQDACFVLRAGEKTALTGENGSGKSTFCKLLATLADQYEGSLTVNGMPLRQIDPAAWRRQIAYAPQEPFLFRGTVRENAGMGVHNAGDPQVTELLDAFGIGDLSDRMITDGSELSGGEKQKISLIRALTKPAGLLILDEPTNHLDRESILWLTIWLSKADKTVLVISHDPAILEILSRHINLTSDPVEIITVEGMTV